MGATRLHDHTSVHQTTALGTGDVRHDASVAPNRLACGVIDARPGLRVHPGQSAGSGAVMARSDGAERRRSAASRRVSVVRPCAIDATGITLYRWPRSAFVPMDQVDRFAVLSEPAE